MGEEPPTCTVQGCWNDAATVRDNRPVCDYHDYEIHVPPFKEKGDYDHWLESDTDDEYAFPSGDPVE